MIEKESGNILHADVEALVNTVNCVGIMGRGIALQFKKEFPSNYTAYRAACERKEVQIGEMFTFDLNRLDNPRLIINFPTKRHWKAKSKIDDIESGIKALVNEVRKRNIRSIAIPPLGSGLGGLEWSLVRPLIEHAFQALPNVRVMLFEPSGAPPISESAKSQAAPAMTAGRAALVGLMRRYLTAVMDPFVTLLEIHKLMYFMQEAGEPLRLDYEKGVYGPYAKNLRHVLNAIDGHFISGFGDAIDNPKKQIELKIGISELAETFLFAHPETDDRFGRVAGLIKGFETSYGMELLSTVHWVVSHEGVSNEADAIEKIHGWSERKRMIPDKHIRLAYQVLEQQNWFNNLPA